MPDTADFPLLTYPIDLITSVEFLCWCFIDYHLNSMKVHFTFNNNLWSIDSFTWSILFWKVDCYCYNYRIESNLFIRLNFLLQYSFYYYYNNSVILKETLVLYYSKRDLKNENFSIIEIYVDVVVIPTSRCLNESSVYNIIRFFPFQIDTYLWYLQFIFRIVSRVY